MVFGDHKLLDFQVKVPKLDFRVGALETSTEFSRLDEVPTSIWRRELELGWNKTGTTEATFDSLKVQESWDLYMNRLKQMFCFVIQSLQESGICAATSEKTPSQRLYSRVEMQNLGPLSKH